MIPTPAKVWSARSYDFLGLSKDVEEQLSFVDGSCSHLQYSVYGDQADGLVYQADLLFFNTRRECALYKEKKCFTTNTFAYPHDLTNLTLKNNYEERRN